MCKVQITELALAWLVFIFYFVVLANIFSHCIIHIMLQVIEPKPEIKQPTSDKKKKKFIFFLGSDN